MKKFISHLTQHVMRIGWHSSLPISIKGLRDLQPLSGSVISALDFHCHQGEERKI